MSDGPDRPTEITLLAAQLDTSMEIFWERLTGLGDEEFLWEPGPGAWSLRPRAHIRTSRSHGAGEWAWEYEPGQPSPAPLRTIGWLIWHMSAACLGRADWTIGGHDLTDDDIPCPPTATAGIALLREAVGRYRAVFDEVPAHEFALVGRSQYPDGLDPQLPLREILWWQNREMIHHCAEVSLLRDLYRHRG